MNKQITSNILMVRPAKFGFNKETAQDNAFQNDSGVLQADQIHEQATIEFDNFVEKLKASGINVYVAQDSAKPVKPDAIFPNNWVSFHADGKRITYPMYSPVRRLERRWDVYDAFKKKFQISASVDFTHFEVRNQFLEGTGSMILDRVNKIAYACISMRTDAALFNRFCKIMNYKPVLFHAVDKKGHPIYHTNVMMAIGETFVVICLEAVENEEDKQQLLASFKQTNKTLIEVTIAQINAFAGNMLQLSNREGKSFLVMSEQAYLSLNSDQIETIKSQTEILYSPLNTIETYGGGGARCMIAEIFLPENDES